ncbi:hypothetical protein FRC12_003866 [Ceratobasidium sp. 428]|nr:hypothetical protein FRC12_003866 [Ceratobasidium sp. 428]
MANKSAEYSSLYGGANTPESINFDDAANDLHPEHSIKTIELNTGWVVDGIKITYRTKQGAERKCTHGTFPPSGIVDHTVHLGANQYISKIDGITGSPNGDHNYGDCIQKIRFQITNSKTHEHHYTDYFGLAKRLKPEHQKHFHWEGRLYAFAGRADNTRTQVGLKGLKFGKFVPPSKPTLTPPCTAFSSEDSSSHLAISAAYGSSGEDRSVDSLGAAYDDIRECGQNIDPKHPIQSIVVSYGSVIDGISVTYNQIDGKTVTRDHGSKEGPGRSQLEIKLEPSENIIEVSGVQGHVLGSPQWGCQVNRLNFTMYDSQTGLLRHSGLLGTGKELDQETRQDILVRGTLAGFKGIADNQAPQVGLNTVEFYTVAS